jgi:hypothetical protein
MELNQKAIKAMSNVKLIKIDLYLRIFAIVNCDVEDSYWLYWKS